MRPTEQLRNERFLAFEGLLGWTQGRLGNRLDVFALAAEAEKILDKLVEYGPFFSSAEDISEA